MELKQAVWLCMTQGQSAALAAILTLHGQETVMQAARWGMSESVRNASTKTDLDQAWQHWAAAERCWSQALAVLRSRQAGH